MADKSRVRLDDDVKKKAEQNGAKNGRSLPQEVNFTLRDIYDNPPVQMRFDLIPPTYWTTDDWKRYAKTCVYPGTEEAKEPLVHPREVVNAELIRMGYQKLIPKNGSKKR